MKIKDHSTTISVLNTLTTLEANKTAYKISSRNETGQFIEFKRLLTDRVIKSLMLIWILTVFVQYKILTCRWFASDMRTWDPKETKSSSDCKVEWKRAWIDLCPFAHQMCWATSRSFIREINGTIPEFHTLDSTFHLVKVNKKHRDNRLSRIGSLS